MLSPARILSRQAKPFFLTISAKSPTGLFFSRQSSTGFDPAKLRDLADALELTNKEINGFTDKTKGLEARVRAAKIDVYSLDEKLCQIQEKTHVSYKKIEDLYDGVLYVNGELNIVETKLNELNDLMEEIKSNLAELLTKLGNQDEKLAQLVADVEKQEIKLKVLVGLLALAGCVIVWFFKMLKEQADSADKIYVATSPDKKNELELMVTQSKYIEAVLVKKVEIARRQKLAEQKSSLKSEFIEDMKNERNRLIEKRERSYPVLGIFSRYNYHVEKIKVLDQLIGRRDLCLMSEIGGNGPEANKVYLIIEDNQVKYRTNLTPGSDYISFGCDLCLISEIGENGTESGKIYFVIEGDCIKYRTSLTPGNDLVLLEGEISQQNGELYRAINGKSLKEISQECKKTLLDTTSKRGHTISLGDEISQKNGELYSAVNEKNLAKVSLSCKKAILNVTSNRAHTQLDFDDLASTKVLSSLLSAYYSRYPGYQEKEDEDFISKWQQKFEEEPLITQPVPLVTPSP